jgi:hypothetical protein
MSEERIEIEIDSNRSLSKRCPLNKVDHERCLVRVGSVVCQRCENYVSWDRDTNTILCRGQIDFRDLRPQGDPIATGETSALEALKMVDKVAKQIGAK